MNQHLKGESVATFRQSPPHLGNQYQEDSYVRCLLDRLLPSPLLTEITPDLSRFGDRVVNDILKYGRDCEANPPRLVQVDQWGNRVDRIIVDNAWDRLKDISAEEGLISIGYERDKYGQYARLYQYVKLYLFAPSCGMFDCPLAMTDGAARLLEVYGDAPMKEKVLARLLSRDPKIFWTSGQWMTERPGGSDVGASETVATVDESGRYLLNGYKFFTSATTSEAAVLLARVRDPKTGKTESGSRGLSAFVIETRHPDDPSRLNGIKIHKLKVKMGTKGLPTAELELIDAPARLIGKQSRGVSIIATILNVTRIHNACTALGYMRRSIAVARDYSHRRMVFGKPLSENPLHLSTLAEMEMQLRGGLQLFFHTCILLGKSESGKTTANEELMIRLLTPLLKLFTAKQAIAVCSESIESLGGVGYMEDSDLPRTFRDSQVLSIWEGTTNVLSMDVWRPIHANGAFKVLVDDVESRLDLATDPKFSSVVASLRSAVANLKSFVDSVLSSQSVDSLTASARRFAFSLTKLYVATLLLDHARWSSDPVDLFVAKCWSEQGVGIGVGFDRVVPSDDHRINMERAVALDCDRNGVPRGCGTIGRSKY